MLRALDGFLGRNLQDGGAFLNRLRVDPSSAASGVSLTMKQAVYLGLTTGGPCGINCRPLALNFYELEAVQGNRDYFFPYVGPGLGGVGSVLVPLDAALGTIVFTNSMQGCAVQVNKRADGFEFYHDANGVSMGSGSGKPAVLVAQYAESQLFRYTSQHYWRPADSQIMAAGTLVRYQFLFVKTSQGWIAMQSHSTERPGAPSSSTVGSRVLGSFA